LHHFISKSPRSTSFFVYLYSIFYFFGRSTMKGFMQGSFFFGYMALVSYGLFLMLGSVGFFASLTFVKAIYKAIKCD
jgi:transmembrane 9 superfamily member 1